MVSTSATWRLGRSLESFLILLILFNSWTVKNRWILLISKHLSLFHLKLDPWTIQGLFLGSHGPLRLLPLPHCGEAWLQPLSQNPGRVLTLYTRTWRDAGRRTEETSFLAAWKLRRAVYTCFGSTHIISWSKTSINCALSWIPNQQFWFHQCHQVWSACRSLSSFRPRHHTGCGATTARRTWIDWRCIPGAMGPVGRSRGDMGSP